MFWLVEKPYLFMLYQMMEISRPHRSRYCVDQQSEIVETNISVCRYIL